MQPDMIRLGWKSASTLLGVWQQFTTGLLSMLEPTLAYRPHPMRPALANDNGATTLPTSDVRLPHSHHPSDLHFQAFIYSQHQVFHLRIVPHSKCHFTHNNKTVQDYLEQWLTLKQVIPSGGVHNVETHVDFLSFVFHLFLFLLRGALRRVQTDFVVVFGRFSDSACSTGSSHQQ